MKTIQPYYLELYERARANGEPVDYIELNHPSLEIAVCLRREGYQDRYEYTGAKKSLIDCGVAQPYMFKVGRSGGKTAVDEYGVKYKTKRYAHGLWRLLIDPVDGFSNPYARGNYRNVKVGHLIKQVSGKKPPIRTTNKRALELCRGIIIQGGKHEFHFQKLMSLPGYGTPQHEKITQKCLDEHGVFIELCEEARKRKDREIIKQMLLDRGVPYGAARYVLVSIFDNFDARDIHFYCDTPK